MVNYFTSIKLRYARELIFNTDKRILDIAMMVGYGSLSHFNRIFKKEYGLSPSQLRNQKTLLKKLDKTI
jgi:two-component system response regulator YesN